MNLMVHWFMILFPLTAEIQGSNSEANWTQSLQGNGTSLDGWSQSIDLDLGNDGYLNSTFDGRTFRLGSNQHPNFIPDPLSLLMRIW